MFNSPGSYLDLRKRVIQHLQSAKIHDLIFEAFRGPYEQAISSEHIVLSRPERERLLAQVLKVVLTDMLAKLDDAK